MHWGELSTDKQSPGVLPILLEKISEPWLVVWEVQ